MAELANHVAAGRIGGVYRPITGQFGGYLGRFLRFIREFLKDYIGRTSRNHQKSEKK